MFNLEVDDEMSVADRLIGTWIVVLVATVLYLSAASSAAELSQRVPDRGRRQATEPKPCGKRG